MPEEEQPTPQNIGLLNYFLLISILLATLGCLFVVIFYTISYLTTYNNSINSSDFIGMIILSSIIAIILLVFIILGVLRRNQILTSPRMIPGMEYDADAFPPKKAFRVIGGKGVGRSYSIWLTINTVLGILFIVWGSLAPELVLIPGDIWLILPGIVMILIGLFGFLEEKLIERRLLRFFSSEAFDRIPLDELSEEFSLDVESLRLLLLSLRVRGLLQVYFNSETGEVMKTSPSDDQACIICGEPNIGSNFCPVCGVEQSSAEN